MNPGGGSGWDEAPLDIQVPDDARELDRDVLAYHRELRAQRRRNRLRRLTSPFSGPGTVMPLLASILAVCLVAGAMLSVATFSPETAPADKSTRPPAATGAASPAPPRSHASATASGTTASGTTASGTSPAGASQGGTSPADASPAGVGPAGTSPGLTGTGASPTGAGTSPTGAGTSPAGGSAGRDSRSVSASARPSASPSTGPSWASGPASPSGWGSARPTTRPTGRP